MPILYAAVGLVALERLAELAYSRRNARRLLRRGGVEHGRGHYPLFVLLHAGWLLGLVVLVPPDRPVSWALLAVYLVLQGARLWIIATLGPYWTTRVITIPGAPLVRRGPYRLFRHPNYAVVVAEIAVLPLAFGAWELAAVFSVANGALLWWRVGVENAALAPRRGVALPSQQIADPLGAERSAQPGRRRRS